MNERPVEQRPIAKGRGSQIAPPNRFETTTRLNDWEQIEQDDDFLDSLKSLPTEYLPDDSRSVVTQNDSPDVSFRYSLNPYRGCSHGCAYCYARPGHEYLGYNAGLDFETKILVKHDAPQLLREFLSKPSWQSENISISGVTDPYQPAERDFKLTRGCLEVAAAAHQAISIISKNALIVRDLDILRGMAAENLVHVNLSITTLDQELARTMEPRTSTPAARLRAVKALSEAGVPVRVMVAPIIPGLNDSEIPAILTAASEAGATTANFVLLRLPLSVKPVFLEWLERTQPSRKTKIEALIRGARDGKLSDSTFGTRMRGTGEVAKQIEQIFKVFKQKLGLDRAMPDYNFSRFERPQPPTNQMRLF